jgi:hypothetical protein
MRCPRPRRGGPAVQAYSLRQHCNASSGANRLEFDGEAGTAPECNGGDTDAETFDARTNASACDDCTGRTSAGSNRSCKPIAAAGSIGGFSPAGSA